MGMDGQEGEKRGGGREAVRLEGGSLREEA